MVPCWYTNTHNTHNTQHTHTHTQHTNNTHTILKTHQQHTHKTLTKHSHTNNTHTPTTHTLSQVLSFQEGRMDPVELAAVYEKEEQLKAAIVFAREYLKGTKVSTDQLKYLCEEAIRGGCPGHRYVRTVCTVCAVRAPLSHCILLPLSPFPAPHLTPINPPPSHSSLPALFLTPPPPHFSPHHSSHSHSLSTRAEIAAARVAMASAALEDAPVRADDLRLAVKLAIFPRSRYCTVL
jgi:hypothetical protein